MTFEYILTLDDIHAFWLYANRQTPYLRRINQVVCGFFFLLGLLGLMAAWWIYEHLAQGYATRPSTVPFTQMLWDWGKVGIVGVVGVTFLIGGATYWKGLPASLWKSLKKQAHTKAIQRLLGAHEFTITPERYSIKTATSERQAEWNDLDSVALSDVACYLFISRHEAVLVPRRGIESSMEWSAFCDRIHSYTAALNTKVAPRLTE